MNKHVILLEGLIRHLRLRNPLVKYCFKKRGGLPLFFGPRVSLHSKEICLTVVLGGHYMRRNALGD